MDDDNVDERQSLQRTQPAPHNPTWQPVMQQQPMDAPVDSVRVGLPQVQVGNSCILLGPEFQQNVNPGKGRGMRGKDKHRRKKESVSAVRERSVMMKQWHVLELP